MGLFCGLKGTPTAPSSTPTSHGVRSPLVNPGPTPSSPSEDDATTTTALVAKNRGTPGSAKGPILPPSAPVHSDPRDDVEVVESDEQQSAKNIFQKAFKKYQSSDDKTDADGHGIMELLNGGGAAKTSPVLTIKRAGRLAGQWQDFIDREQSSVDQVSMSEKRFFFVANATRRQNKLECLTPAV